MIAARSLDVGSAEVTTRAARGVDDLCRAGLAELKFSAYALAQFCTDRGITLSARGSATSSLVAWCLRLVQLCPLDYGLDGQLFVHEGRGDLPDLDLQIPSLHEPVVSAGRDTSSIRHCFGPTAASSDQTTNPGWGSETTIMPLLDTLENAAVEREVPHYPRVTPAGTTRGCGPHLSGHTLELARQAPLLVGDEPGWIVPFHGICPFPE